MILFISMIVLSLNIGKSGEIVKMKGEYLSRVIRRAFPVFFLD